MTHDNRSRIAVDQAGNWKLYTNTIPQGDGYNSDWANTISDAADELFDLRAKNAELVADYRIFAEWVYALSMHGIEIYKHELAASADTLTAKLESCCRNQCRSLSRQRGLS